MLLRHLVRPVAAALAVIACDGWAAAAADGAARPEPSRGELLYGTHCLQCHTDQIHWRERKLARDWASLRVQVDRWQRAAQLGWSAEDVSAVARYLNETVYGFAGPTVSARGVH